MVQRARYLSTLQVIALLTALGGSQGVLVNVTVDDENGDQRTQALPSYTPEDKWAQGATCTKCLAQPDSLEAFDYTWHDSTQEGGESGVRTIEMTFTGSAVYVFFILANEVTEYVTTLTNVTFSLDGSYAGSYVHSPSPTTDYQYNVPVYVNASLENSQHIFEVRTTGEANSLILFDYLIY
ncbi:hypothetical protein DFH11DRAFT_1505911, partial [Phellopilus nigrolimitatus]